MIDLEPTLSCFLVIAARVIGFLYACPLLSDKFISHRIRAMVAISVSFYFYLILNFDSYEFNYDNLPVLSIVNLLFGIMIGMLLSVAFNFLAFAGHLIAMSSGLGFSTLADPQNGTQITTVANFYKISGALIFVTAGGLLAHHQILLNSFVLFDLIFSEFEVFGSDFFLPFFRFCFNNALMISIPVIITVLLLNVGFGVISKASPSMNIFAIGFPVSIIVTFIVVFLSIDRLPFFVFRYLSLEVF